MILRNLILSIIIFWSELALPQTNWQSINSEEFQNIEDIAITNEGKIYVSLKNKNIILESKNQGNSWTNITNDTFIYNPLQDSKDLHIDDKDRLIEFYSDGGIYFGRYYLENEGFKLLDSVIKLQLLYNTIKHAENGISYSFRNNYITRYKINWSEIENIILLPVKIVAIFPYTSDINYALGYENNRYYIYKFNSSDYTYSEINNFGILQGSEDFYISKQGHIYLASPSGLFFSVNPDEVPQRIQLDPKYSRFDPIRNLILTTENQIIVKTNRSCFITHDDGQSWVELIGFNNNFPTNIDKIIAFDSSLAIAMVNEDHCGNIGLNIFKPGSSSWAHFKFDYSLWNFTNVFKNIGDRLFAKPDYCAVLYSENEGETWKNLTYNGSELITVFPLHNKELIGIDINQNLLISNNNGNSFTPANFQAQGINYIGNTLYGTQYSLLFFGIKDGAGDYIDTVVIYRYENNNWTLIGRSKLPNPQALRYYFSSGKKLYAYSFISPGIYVSANDGLSWNIDTTFKDFKKIVDLRIENNGVILVSGEKYNGEINLFESVGDSNFKPTSSYFQNKFIGIYDKYYPKIIAINNIGGISISDDGGHTWNDFNNGLPIFSKEFIIFNSLFWDSEDYIFVSIAYDGLYKTINKITSVAEVIKSNKHAVYPNPFVDRLHIDIDSNVNTNGAVFRIYTLSGIEIQSFIISGTENEIKLESNLMAGYYLYEIFFQNGNILNGKLVKI